MAQLATEARAHAMLTAARSDRPCLLGRPSPAAGPARGGRCVSATRAGLRPCQPARPDAGAALGSIAGPFFVPRVCLRVAVAAERLHALTASVPSGDVKCEAAALAGALCGAVLAAAATPLVAWGNVDPQALPPLPTTFPSLADLQMPDPKEVLFLGDKRLLPSLRLIYMSPLFAALRGQPTNAGKAEQRAAYFLDRGP